MLTNLPVLFFLRIFCLSSFALSTTPPTPSLVNRTIDDQYGDEETRTHIAYVPPLSWAQGSRCSSCAFHPGNVDVSKTHDGTWHGSTYHPEGSLHEVSVKFIGVAVYVYGIIPNSMSAGSTSVTTYVNLSFVLDDEHVGRYVHQPNDSSVIEYSVPVYVNTSLSNEGHSLSIQLGGSSSSLFLFDYVVYTTVEAISSTSTVLPTLSSPASLPGTSSVTSLQETISPHASSSTVPPTSPRSHHITELVGGIVGGTLAVTLIVMLLYVFRRRRLRPPPSLPLSAWNQQFFIRRRASAVYHAEVSECPPDHSFPGARDDSAESPHETLSYHDGAP